MNINNFYNTPRQYIIEDTKIIDVDYLGNRNQIGVTNQAYQELKEMCEKYYDKLVELKIIIPPKTPEQIQAEQLEIMQGLINQMQAMQKEIEVLKNAKSADISSGDAVKSGTSKKITGSMATGQSGSAKH